MRTLLDLVHYGLALHERLCDALSAAGGSACWQMFCQLLAVQIGI